MSAPSTSGAFLQLFDGPDGGGSSTFTYILGDAVSKEAVIIDPVLEQVERNLAALSAAGLTLTMALNTHCHADHITGTGKLKGLIPGMKSVISKDAQAKADMLIAHGDKVQPFESFRGTCGGGSRLRASLTHGCAWMW